MAVSAFVFFAVYAGLAQNLDSSREIEANLTRAVVVRPRLSADGYSAPETSSYSSHNTIQFALDSAALTDAAKAQLDEAAQALRSVLSRAVVVKPKADAPAGSATEPPPSKILIAGHTCDLGTPAYNQSLSERRAQAVLEYLVSRGVDRLRLEWRGYGEERPVASNTGEANRALNRRVDFVLRERASRLQTRGLNVSGTGPREFLEAKFEAIAKSDNGRRHYDNAIDGLKSGDLFRVEVRALEGCHVYVLMRESQGRVKWLWPEPGTNAAHVAYGLWCYPGQTHRIPALDSTEAGLANYWVLDDVPGLEVVCVVATPKPVGAPKLLEERLLADGERLTAQAVRDATGVPEAELHVLTVKHN